MLVDYIVYHDNITVLQIYGGTASDAVSDSAVEGYMAGRECILGNLVSKLPQSDPGPRNFMATSEHVQHAAYIMPC